MSRRSRSRGRKKLRLSDDVDDIFADPNHEQIRDRHRHQSRRSQHQHHEPQHRHQHQHQYKLRNPNPNDKQAGKKGSPKKDGRSQHHRQQNRGRKLHTPNQSTDEIFADPSSKHRGNQSQQKHHHQTMSQVVSDTTDHGKEEYQKILVWVSPLGYIPLWQEENMVEFMFKRNGKKERGMMKGKPNFLLTKYKKVMRELAPGGMSLPQVLSLRRHHIKLLNPSKNMTQLGLGSFDVIRESARIFEVAVEEFLKKSLIDYLTEDDQQRKAKEDGAGLTATPDFLLPKPVLLRKVRKKKADGENILPPEDRTIRWIEVKMFYGASSIPHGGSGAVGSILSQAQKYVDKFGEGALLFMMGCGQQLAADLNKIGVSVLDCDGDTVSLDKVHDHQRTWCANEKGHILP